MAAKTRKKLEERRQERRQEQRDARSYKIARDREQEQARADIGNNSLK